MTTSCVGLVGRGDRMTEGRKGKRAIRARMAATGGPYTLARRRVASNPQDRQGVVLAQRLHVDLVAALRRGGLAGRGGAAAGLRRVLLLPGASLAGRGPPRPAQLRGRRRRPRRRVAGRPDTPPTGPGDRPQLDAGDGIRVQASLDGQRPVDDLVAALADLLVDGLAEALRTAADDAACSICGDRYPTQHLLAPTGAGRVAVCPACVFDGDLLHARSTAALAGQLDRLLATDLAAPAGRSAVAALLATAARPGLGDRAGGRQRPPPPAAAGARPIA